MWWFLVAYGADPVPVGEMHATLEALQQTIHSVHPDPFAIRSEAEQARALRLALRATRKPLEGDAFAGVAMRLAAELRDAHTSVRYTGADRWLPARFVWAHDGLAIAEGPHTGVVERIGGHRPDDLLEALTRVVAAENPHWVRRRAERRLGSRSLWRALGEDAEAIEVVFADGRRDTLAFEADHALVAPSSEPATWWAVVPDADLGWLRLASCPDPTPAYHDRIDDLFHELQARDLGTLVIDVRGNGGGHSGVLDPILQHLPGDTHAAYGGYRRVSELAAEHKGFDPAKVKVQPGTDLTVPMDGRWAKSRRHQRLTPYDGDVLVLTDSGTFSSGNWIAVVLDDNDLAQTVGEPTGNAPSSFGDLLTVPVGDRDDLRLSVSTTRWLRPDASRDPATTLEPDHLVLASVAQRLAGEDPVWDWVLDRQEADPSLPPPVPDPTLAPHVVSTVPAQGARDVDPALDTLVVTFSEAMSPHGMALLGGGDTFPEPTAQPMWTWTSPTTLELHVALKPGVTYQIGVNSARYDSLRGLDGTPSRPFPWTFTTAE